MQIIKTMKTVIFLWVLAFISLAIAYHSECKGCESSLESNEDTISLDSTKVLLINIEANQDSTLKKLNQ